MEIAGVEMTFLVMANIAFVLIFLWYWAVHYKPHDDDDEVYTAMFGASASPIATPNAYVKILERVPMGGHILDLGVGSGVYLEHEPARDMIRARNVKVDGVDISAPNIRICQERIKKYGLQDHFSAVCQDARTLGADGKYDAILFMESFPVMSKKLFVDIFKSVQPYLKADTGVNYLYHNLSNTKKVGLLNTTILKIMKPSMKLFIGVDYGRLTTKREMERLCRKIQVENYEDEILLKADTSDLNIDLSNVQNKMHRVFSQFAIGALRCRGGVMEQHLITIPQGSAISPVTSPSKPPGGFESKKTQ